MGQHAILILTHDVCVYVVVWVYALSVLSVFFLTSGFILKMINFGVCPLWGEIY